VSVLDDFTKAEQRLVARMRELEPLVAEYRDLERVAQRLGIDVSGGAPRRRSRRAAGADPQAAAPNGSRPTPRARRRRSGAQPDRSTQLLAVVNSQPGVTVREVASRLGVDPTSLYRIVRRLEADGALQKRGRELVPAGSPDTPAAPSSSGDAAND
jgi:CRP-like cAMP-binding protein